MFGKLSRLFVEFFESERSGGLVLILCTAVSIAVSNSALGHEYLHFWHYDLDLSFLIFKLDHSVQHWINDGLMAIFFLLVGLEIERELYEGELSSVKNAALKPVLYSSSMSPRSPAECGKSGR